MASDRQMTSESEVRVAGRTAYACAPTLWTPARAPYGVQAARDPVQGPELSLRLSVKALVRPSVAAAPPRLRVLAERRAYARARRLGHLVPPGRPYGRFRGSPGPVQVP